ncbi:GAF domain-containing protein [Citromicrobium bathyomarinum]|uniref:GAF domain-containing protein n=1 Tax=Citromicrobium bathyomarinum TaxID=72174 RepID=UPI001E565D92|nr:GAF domain-containing protein [Citromicrobium bathyomarinum]MCD1622422.1 hypothetical protein [Citromicrobium bathyomarinum]
MSIEDSEFDELEKKLRPNRKSALVKVDERIRQLERFRFWFVVIAIGGTILLAVSRSFQVEGLLWLGVGMSAVGLVLTAAIDYRKIDLTKYFTLAEDTALTAIEAGRKLEAVIAERSVLDRKRLAYREAANAMREGLEQSLLSPTSTLVTALEFMLQSAEPKLIEAIGLEGSEGWAISIFMRTGNGGSARMSPVCGIRSKLLPPPTRPRAWPKNKGLVGVVWHTGRDAIIADYTDPQVLQDYPVPTDLKRTTDAERYASMAGIPVIVGPDQKIRGVVAASTDAKGRFKRDPQNNLAQSVDTVRMVAKFVALAIASFDARDN